MSVSFYYEKKEFLTMAADQAAKNEIRGEQQKRLLEWAEKAAFMSTMLSMILEGDVEIVSWEKVMPGFRITAPPVS